MHKNIPPARFEAQNTKNQNTTKPSTTTPMLTEENRKKLDLIKKIITKRQTILSFHLNQDWTKVKVEIEKVYKLFKISQRTTSLN